MNFKAMRLVARRHGIPINRRMRYADGQAIIAALIKCNKEATHYLIDSGSFLRVKDGMLFIFSESGYWSRLSTDADVVDALPDSKILVLN